MEIIRYLPLTILLFFCLKFLISFLEKSTISLINKNELSKIENGILSIKDLEKNNYDRFIKVIEEYLNLLYFKDITLLPNGKSELTNFKCKLNNETVLVSCIQNDLLGKVAKEEDDWSLTGRPEVQCFLSRVFTNNCNKGILITNSTFSEDAITFVDKLNNQNLDMEIKLIDGYELTKTIRNYKTYTIKDGVINEI